MPQVAPFYCIRQLVYHTHNDCPQAQLISRINQRGGTGGKVACLCCRRLSKLTAKGACLADSYISIPRGKRLPKALLAKWVR